MKYTSVKFKIDPQQDRLNCRLFERYSPPRFLPRFLPDELRRRLAEAGGNKKERERLTRQFVEDSFRQRRTEIARNVTALTKRWRALEGGYFSLMAEVFGNHPWPKGKYLGYASVFQMFPRDIKDKTFYFSAFDPNLAVKTVAHELTHFIFFDCLKAKYGLKEDSVVLGRGRSYVWNVSETFNLTLERWAPYRKLLGTSGRPYDAMHARMLPRMRRRWGQGNDIDRLLSGYFGRPSIARRKPTAKN